jgi:hypothetical protein
VEGQVVEAQKFYCRSIKFKDNTLNSQYIRKLRNISDQFDGEKRIFDLYEEDGSIVKSLPSEKFIVALNGVLQNARSNEEEPFENAYAIIRSQNPNTTDKIAFTSPPISFGELYDSTDDIVIREKCFIYSVGSYRRLGIDSRTIKFRGSGPFLILDEVENSVVSIDDPLYAIVFIDGILQIPGKSYDIVGPNITFSSPLQYYEDESGKQTLPKVSILLFFGRDKAKTLTFYDFEPNTYYAQAYLNIETPYSQSFYNWFSNYVGSSVIVYQNGYQIGKIKSFVPGSEDVRLTLLCSAFFDVTNDNFTFIDLATKNQYTITSVQSSSITFLEDEDGNKKLQVDVPPWLFGTELGRSAYLERTKLYANLNVGDLIQIDGENNYREIVSIPELVNTKQYNVGEFLPSDIYARVQTTNYNDIVRGEGLSITAEIDANGTVTKLNWNRRDLNLFFNNNILLQPTAYQYFTPPVIDFIPRTQNGGGAKAEVIAVGGQIVDLVLIDGGSGYEESPKVVVSRGYNKIKGKSRKFDTTTVLEVSPPATISQSLVTNSEVTIIAYGPAGQSIFSLIVLSADGGIREAGEEITNIITPPAKIVTLDDTTYYEVTLFLSAEEVKPSVQNVEKQIIGFIDVPFNVVSSSTVSKVDNQITRIITKKVNEAIDQVDTASINDIGAFLDAPMTISDNIVYIPDTRRFPDSSRLLIGNEIVYYEKKKSDRFLDVIRGADGTTAQTHEAGDYLRHLPKLISIVPVGVSEVQTITSIESEHNTFTEVLTQVNVELSDPTLSHDSTLLTTEDQIHVDNTDIDIIKSITIIPPTSINVITTIHSTTSEVKTFREAAALEAITTSLITIVDSTTELLVEQNIDVDISNVIIATNIVLSAGSSFESISFINSKLTTSQIRTFENNLNILSNVSIQNYNTQIIQKFDASVETFISHVNTIQNAQRELTLNSQIYTNVINSYSSTTVLQSPIRPLETKISISVSSTGKLSVSRETNYRLGIIDFYQETIILDPYVVTRNSGTVILDDPINQIYTQNNGIIEVINSSVLQDDFYAPYNLGNAGMTLKSFEDNLSIDTGALSVSGSIQSLTSAFGDLTINDFEQRSNSAFTLSGKFFNLGIPSINDVGSTLSSAIANNSTSLTVNYASNFPSSGKIIINGEVITYTSKVGNVLGGLIRGSDNTIPSSHNAGDYLRTY